MVICTLILTLLKIKLMKLQISLEEKELSKQDILVII